MVLGGFIKVPYFVVVHKYYRYCVLPVYYDDTERVCVRKYTVYTTESA